MSFTDLLRKLTPLAIATNETETPGGTRYWKPMVEADLIPKKGKLYDSLQKGIHGYALYADKGGFDIRLSTQRKLKGGFIKEKYVLCNKAGIPTNINIDTLDPANSGKTVRNTNIQITGCKAQIRFTSIPGSTKYRVSDFVDEHNHMLVPSEYRHLTRKQRQLKYSEQLWILKSSFANIGGTKAHHYYSNLKGSIKNVHGTALDFKNFKRDINCFIGDSDAQMLINKMENRKKYVPKFSFEYVVEDAEFSSMFWADEVAKCNFQEFGDIISFDATYRTNK
jgi:hypothetical protein